MVMFELANGYRKKLPEASAGFSSVQFQGDQRLRPNCEHHQPRWTLWQLWPGDTVWSAADHHWSFFPWNFVNHHVTYVDHHVNHHVTLINLYICPAEHGNFGYPLQFVSVGLWTTWSGSMFWAYLKSFGLNMDPAKSYETMVIQQWISCIETLV